MSTLRRPRGVRLAVTLHAEKRARRARPRAQRRPLHAESFLRESNPRERESDMKRGKRRKGSVTHP
ncbi:hypothetical protein EYF80_044790 [Liparis tanakae]|uniref:Uncharacterized protein n=1 Tax=Liparis tanakae TaxID=230148 RepID=A0A4Z2FUW0_9TELE|nr:hypothetical protein EYF80_044790 [Liparis tanakae]